MGADSKSLSLLIMIYLPVLTDNFQDKHKEILMEQSVAFSNFPPTKTKISMKDCEQARLWMALATPPLLLVIVFSPSVPALQSPWLLLNGIFLYFICPLLGGFLNALIRVKPKGTCIGIYLVSVLAFIICFFLPLLVQGPIGLMTSIFSLGLLVLVLLLLSRHGREDLFPNYLRFVYLPYLAIASGLAFIGLLFQINGLLATPYVRICIVVIIFLGYFFLLLAVPTSSTLRYLLNIDWLWHETTWLHQNMKWETNIASRNQKYLSSKKK